MICGSQGEELIEWTASFTAAHTFLMDTLLLVLLEGIAHSSLILSLFKFLPAFSWGKGLRCLYFGDLNCQYDV